LRQLATAAAIHEVVLLAGHSFEAEIGVKVGYRRMLSLAEKAFPK
jgi:hypothetical protein